MEVTQCCFRLVLNLYCVSVIMLTKLKYTGVENCSLELKEICRILRFVVHFFKTTPFFYIPDRVVICYSRTSYGHRRDETKCPYYGGVRIIEEEFVWNLVSFEPSELYVIERCPYYRGRVCMEFGLFRTK